MTKVVFEAECQAKVALDKVEKYAVLATIDKQEFTNCLLTQKQKDWIRRGYAKWFYNISAMLVKKVPSEIVYTNISKMYYLPTRRKNNNFVM